MKNVGVITVRVAGHPKADVGYVLCDGVGKEAG